MIAYLSTSPFRTETSDVNISHNTSMQLVATGLEDG